MLSTIRDHLYSALYPQACPVCNDRLTSESNGVVCIDCWNKTEIFDGSEAVCPKCGKHAVSTKQSNCRQCDDHEYDRAHAIGKYSNALKAAVVGLKTKPYLSTKIELLLVDTFHRNQLTEISLIIPVPLSRQRKFERGFNQSEVIAYRLARHLGTPVDPFSLLRDKHSPIHRAGMDEKARDLSVRNSFKVVRPKLIAGQKVLLVDDVLTTGATTSYCAKALKRSGATEVNVLTLARAV